MDKLLPNVNLEYSIINNEVIIFNDIGSIMLLNRDTLILKEKGLKKSYMETVEMLKKIKDLKDKICKDIGDIKYESIIQFENLQGKFYIYYLKFLKKFLNQENDYLEICQEYQDKAEESGDDQLYLSISNKIKHTYQYLNILCENKKIILEENN